MDGERCLVFDWVQASLIAIEWLTYSLSWKIGEKWYDRNSYWRSFYCMQMFCFSFGSLLLMILNFFFVICYECLFEDFIVCLVYWIGIDSCLIWLFFEWIKVLSNCLTRSNVVSWMVLWDLQLRIWREKFKCINKCNQDGFVLLICMLW